MQSGRNQKEQEMKDFDNMARFIHKRSFAKLDQNETLFVIQLSRMLGINATASGETLFVRLKAIHEDQGLRDLFANNRAYARKFLTAINDLARTKNLNNDFIFNTPLGQYLTPLQPPRKAEDYEYFADIKRGETTVYNVVKEVRKKILAGTQAAQKHLRRWFRKEMTELSVASREVLAQELFRLFIPYQPKARLAISSTGKAQVLSEGVKGYTSLADLHPQTISKKIMSGEYTGMGEVLVMSLLMNEVDLKLANLGVDKQGRIIKIDGDWCFAGLRDKAYQNSRSNITEELISKLPYKGKYHAWNWLDQLDGGFTNTNAVMTNFEKAPAFRNEINAALLKVIIMPDEFLKQMVDFHMSDPSLSKEKEEVMRELLSRKVQIKAAAYANPSFRAFVNTTEAVRVNDDFFEEMVRFKMRGKNYLVQPQAGQSQQNVIDKFKSENDLNLFHIITELLVPPSQKISPNLLSISDLEFMIDTYVKERYAGDITKVLPDTKQIIQQLRHAKDDISRYNMAAEYIKANSKRGFAVHLKSELSLDQQKDLTAGKENKP